MQEKKIPLTPIVAADAVIKVFPHNVLCYNPYTDKIISLNKGELDFSEIFSDEEENAENIFTAVAKEEIVHFKNEWNKCRHLKENEKYSFKTVIQTSQHFYSLKVDAAGVRSEDGTDLIILTFTNITAEGDAASTERAINSLLQKKIVELEKERSDFLYAATHDLQAPLRKISTFIERLFSKLPADYSSQIEPYRSKIVACSEEMKILIDNLFLLYETKQKKLHTDVCDLKLILNTVMNEMKDVLMKEYVIIQYNLLPVIKGDKDQLKILFRNIFLNALANKRTTEKLLIDVNAGKMFPEEIAEKHLLETNNYYKITITHNGTGFSDAQAESIFNPFFRLQAKTSYSVHGLELAICKNIVDNHEGKIQALSNENMETQIIIILPSK